MKKAVITSLMLGAMPFIASAQLENIEDIVVSIGDIIDLLVPIVFALAILYFFWGLAQFILASGDETARAEGRQKMIWGIVAIAVMASIWGLVFFLQDAVGVSRVDAPSIDVIPTVN
ncbi:MAG: hypothetical protein COV34_01350 [Candidatus Zambryskibacteria bacterium CG10_big_fil_rev_8_21_14_0_10_42_12]|uniref:Uncharacterized protein n=1 Tax=Candidatus Zambryskibacteria bacterium CG10_big_fil_rev_8_21_14_0_10_42_12 TaxID=1975115 RepID=A0A2H0QVD6_9BACT|nr:MAG: hypothetical protein COV34_01350 [Candidatus Zambryskibacteria bacterium CG10_big_fil_rev_8_21_14_0_10_42_12]